MSESTESATAHAGGAHHDEKYYIRIWGILVVLLIVSVLGPMLGIKILTLITAFGIALVKAYLVAKNFMHVNVERPIVHYFLITALAFMVLFFAGTAPDVMKHDGQNWNNDAAKAEIERAQSATDEHGDEHSDEEGSH